MNRNLQKSIWGGLGVREINILKSPKKGGSSDIDAAPYLEELAIEISENRQPIQFAPNINEHIHRWAPYVQGFSAIKKNITIRLFLTLSLGVVLF